MQRSWVFHGSSAMKGMTIQLAGSYLLTGSIVLIVVSRLDFLHFSPTFVIACALVVSMGIGLLATFNLQQRIVLLYLAQESLTANKPISITPSFWHWPLTPLFSSLLKIVQKQEEVLRREWASRTYRDQWLRQASEAAALEERNRLARELHDSIKQQLFNIRMSALSASTRMRKGVDGAREAIEDIQRSASEAQVEMKALLQQLRSTALEHTTLEEAVQTQAQALEYRSQAQVQVEMTDLPSLEQCPQAMREELFRVIQETFTNIARHARAQQVRCTMAGTATMVIIMIKDDGQGFDIENVQQGMGLKNIQERVRALQGTVHIESQVGHGTTVNVQVPLLRSVDARQQDEQLALDIQHVRERLQGGRHLRAMVVIWIMIMLAVDLTCFSMHAPTLFKTIVWALLGFCFLLIISSLIMMRPAIARMMVYCGEQDQETRAFCFYERLGWLRCARLLLLASWHVVPWGLNILAHLLPWQATIGVLWCLGLIILLYVSGHRWVKQAQDRYYVLLSTVVLTRAVQQRQRDLRWRTIMCVCIAAPLLIQSPLPFVAPAIYRYWFLYALLYIALLLSLGNVLEKRQLQLWRRRSIEQGVSQQGKTHA